MTEAVRRLYALGGMEALPFFTPHWLEVCGPRVAVFSHAHSKKYAAFYRDLWPSVTVRFVAQGGPDANPDINPDTDTGAAEALAWASALFVAGGDTRRYWQLYAQEPLRTHIRQRYAAGMPYAGLSAGALLAAERCLWPTQDTGQPNKLHGGLGLLPRTLFGVHFTVWGGAASFQPVQKLWPEAQALGLDDHVTAYFENETLTKELGGEVVRLTHDLP